MSQTDVGRMKADAITVTILVEHCNSLGISRRDLIFNNVDQKDLQLAIRPSFNLVNV